MVSFLTLFGGFLWLLALAACGTARGAPAEIEGLILFLTGALFMCTAVLVQVLERIAPPKSKNTKPGSGDKAGTAPPAEWSARPK